MTERETFRFLCCLCDISSIEERRSSLTDRAKAYMEFEGSGRPGVSQCHLSREFVKYIGEQPIRYLTKVRLEHAVELLCSTDMKLEEISVSCGFSDCNYFYKMFKNI